MLFSLFFLTNSTLSENKKSGLKATLVVSCNYTIINYMMTLGTLYQVKNNQQVITANATLVSVHVNQFFIFAFSDFDFQLVTSARGHYITAVPSWSLQLNTKDSSYRKYHYQC